MKASLQELHICEQDARRLLDDSLAGFFRLDEHHPAINTHLENTVSGEASLQRLRAAMQGEFSQFDADLGLINLKIAIDFLKQYRSRLECIKIDN